MALDQAEADFVTAVSSATGIDPRVLIAWSQQEGANAPGGTGHFNYLNLRPYPGDPYSGVSGGNFEQFANVKDAETATIRRLRQPFASSILQTAANRPTPRAEIAAIASTGWDSGHYGGPGGPNLLATFNQIFSGGADTPYVGGDAARGIANSAGTGSAADKGSVDLGTAPGTKQIIAGAKDTASAIESVPNLISFVTSYRFLEIVGGSLLILIGLSALMKEIGVNVPVPPAAAPLTRAVPPGLFQSAPAG